MAIWLEIGIGFFFLLLMFVLLSMTTPRQWTRAPRESHASVKKIGWFLVAIFVFNTGVGILTGNAVMTGSSAVALAVWLYIVFFSGDALSDEGTARINYALDSRYCGRCGYDLTGNRSGVCPECGWAPPALPVAIPRPDWTLWWRRWRVEHLQEPARLRRQLLFTGVVMLAVAGGVWMLSLGAAIVLTGISAHFLINCLRVNAQLAQMTSDE